MGFLSSIEGRYSRAKYFWFYVGVGVAHVILAIVIGLFYSMAHIDLSGVLQGFFIKMPYSLWLIYLMLANIPLSILAAFLIVKRFHDLDRPARHYWLLWIPFYNIYIYLLLSFKKGTDGPNPYGPDPLAD